ncbi:hypothetical protein caldi_30310 [Caldinitratiruptor microaerophilus]|uniref:Uncharacterized protein n=1 Tax=Caldinitratiruptor microaerophilus TaxID=671077 RepID=A0AA35G9C0_9FIRM|nr:hypothetical protein caldi_30310 [Caldinitratiruptor microaerophilus]
MPGIWDLQATLTEQQTVRLTWDYGPCTPAGECEPGWQMPARVAITRATCPERPASCAVADISFKLLTELLASETAWNDTSVESGKEYIYRLNVFSKEGVPHPVPVLTRIRVP